MVSIRYQLFSNVFDANRPSIYSINPHRGKSMLRETLNPSLTDDAAIAYINPVFIRITMEFRPKLNGA